MFFTTVLIVNNALELDVLMFVVCFLAGYLYWNIAVIIIINNVSHLFHVSVFESTVLNDIK